MYKIVIETEYNIINLITDNPEEYKEVFEQPYVKNVSIKELKTVEELIAERDAALSHVVGTSYWHQRVLELNKEIEEAKECQKKEK